MRSQKKETLFEANRMLAKGGKELTVSYSGRPCAEFVYFLRGELFLGVCRAALNFSLLLSFGSSQKKVKA